MTGRLTISGIGCYGMWVGTELDNAAAQATYRKAGANEEAPLLLLSWVLT